MIITIDGPTASGKSSIGRALAKHLDYYYVNSGLFYRAVAYLLITKKGYELEGVAHARLEDVQECLDPKRFRYEYHPATKEHVFFDGVEITPFLKDSVIDQGASMCSTDIRVREEINTFMRHLGEQSNLVLDGRDAGTVVFPRAEIKFFLTATLAVRARRWIIAQLKLGHAYTPAQAIILISERDDRDRTREVAPLRIPDDAFIIDNSKMTRAQTLSYMLLLIKQKLK